MVYTKNNIDYAYGVKFVDKAGRTLALLTMKEDDIELVAKL
jgi:hypothetical protein